MLYNVHNACKIRAVVSSFAVVRLMCAWRKADRKTITDNDNDSQLESCYACVAKDYILTFIIVQEWPSTKPLASRCAKHRLIFPNDRLGNVKLLGWLGSSGRLGSDDLKTAFAAIPRALSLFDFLHTCVLKQPAVSCAQ